MSPSVMIQQRRQLAGELGRHGIRVVSLLTGGIIDAIRDDFAGLDDVGNVAAFAASDHARTITASSINISCGAIVT